MLEQRTIKCKRCDRAFTALASRGRRICDECIREKNRSCHLRGYYAHSEERKQSAREWQQAHPEETKETQRVCARKRTASNPERDKAIKEAFAKRHGYDSWSAYMKWYGQQRREKGIVTKRSGYTKACREKWILEGK